MRFKIASAALIGVLVVACAATEARAEESVEQLVERAKKSVVVITVTGRDGAQQGLGAGFIIDKRGLVATNLHVIGEARPIDVRLADGRRFSATAVEASDRKLDLALVRIKADNLTPLELGDSETLKEGQSVVAIGNPLGLTQSVVRGVVSAKREIDGRKMIQLAIPIEPGNSGGPLLDLEGRVHGVLTLKSAVTQNLGFAMTSNALATLRDKPNPIPIERWLTIGVLNARDWSTLFGGQWRQRAGKILSQGAGAGFGGRTLCIAKREELEPPFEVSVEVKLTDSSGAAGLIFGGDGGDHHFGLYPSAGRIRLTKFEGPDVTSWRVLHDEATEHFRPTEWNTIKARVEKGRVVGFVNGEKVVDFNTDEAATGAVGLASFRGTPAEFRNFQYAREIVAAPRIAEVDAAVQKIVANAESLKKSGKIDDAAILDHPSESTAILRREAQQLQERAKLLEKIARRVHVEATLRDLERAVASDETLDLIHAGLLIARLDNESLDVEAYRREVEALAEEVKEKLDKDSDEKTRLAALDEHLFRTLGFHGSRIDYYNRSNSYLNEVLDDREGLPITMCVIYMELARRLGVTVEGVGLPGHFVARHVPKVGNSRLIDVFDNAATLSLEGAAELVTGDKEAKLTDEQLAPISKRAILTRILHNLMGVAQKEGDAAAVLRYQDAILVITPDAVEERMARALFLAQTGEHDKAIEDIDWILEKQPPQVDLDRVRDLKTYLENLRADR